MNDFEPLFQELGKYPTLHSALRPYVEWAVIKTPGNGIHHKVIRALRNKDNQTLGKLDKLFADAQSILGINADEFNRAFGFHDDL